MRFVCSIVFYLQLLVYAQIFSNGSGTPVVIPPAYIGRRVRSNPSSPSYTQLHLQGRNAKQFSELLQGSYDERDRRPAYDPIYVSVLAFHKELTASTTKTR